MEKSEVITSIEIAEKEKLSSGVTMKILRELVQIGVMEVRQGRGKICGGFSLIKGIDEVTMLEVVTAFEGVNICINISEPVDKEGGDFYQMCNLINEQIKELFVRYTVRNLFEPNENLLFVNEKG